MAEVECRQNRLIESKKEIEDADLRRKDVIITKYEFKKIIIFVI